MEVGRSVEHRLIEGRWIGERGTPVLLFGAIHGDEPDSAALCALLLDGDVALARRTFVVPVTNPDGLWRGTKNNARDVDLNRNFPAANWSTEHAPGYFPGSAAGSEPETQALAALVAAIAPALIIAVHQPFECVNWDGPADDVASALAEALGYPLRPSLGYPTPGSFGSLYGVERSVPVVTLELGRAPLPKARILETATALARVLDRDDRLG